jgi:hypothetical protein
MVMIHERFVALGGSRLGIRNRCHNGSIDLDCGMANHDAATFPLRIYPRCYYRLARKAVHRVVSSTIYMLRYSDSIAGCGDHARASNQREISTDIQFQMQGNCGGCVEKIQLSGLHLDF